MSLSSLRAHIIVRISKLYGPLTLPSRSSQYCASGAVVIGGIVQDSSKWHHGRIICHSAIKNDSRAIL
jgi:hypothetical protein